jgi:hypothetical protein
MGSTMREVMEILMVLTILWVFLVFTWIMCGMILLAICYFLCTEPTKVRVMNFWRDWMDIFSFKWRS